VAPALALEGCRVFFTAHLEEGMRLRQVVPEDSTIYVLHGPPPGATAEFFQYDLVPVLNDPGQLADWRRPVPQAWGAACRPRCSSIPACRAWAWPRPTWTQLLADPSWKDESSRCW
jgi:hypothetical protein